MRLLILLFLLIPGNALAAECSPSSFASFFTTFSNVRTFAMANTIYPLRYVRWDYGVDEKGNEESEKIVKHISKAKDENSPVLSAFMQENGLEYRITDLTDANATVTIFKEGTDWIFVYHFQCKSNRWRLYEVEDLSLQCPQKKDSMERMLHESQAILDNHRKSP